MTRRLDSTKQFRKDFKKMLKTHFSPVLAPGAEYDEVVRLLQNDVPLERKHADHPLSGAWEGYRDCHVKPDLVLIYEKIDPDWLVLVRIGTHSDLF